MCVKEHEHVRVPLLWSMEHTDSLLDLVSVFAGARLDSPQSESGGDTPAFHLALPVQSPSARSTGKG